jgi:hypothetical protein
MKEYTLKLTSEGWSFSSANKKNTIGPFSSRSEAMFYARDFMTGTGATLKVYKEDGTLEMTINECSFLNCFRISNKQFQGSKHRVA